jgi:hypothetical protein
MALSGTISGAYRGYTLQTTWTATQNTAGNYSDITATHKLICDSTFALYIDGRTNTCTVDGTAKSFASSAISTGGGTTITLGTTTHRVYHNADGTKAFTMTTVFNMQADIVGTWVSNITASGTITLNTIPRRAQITGANNFNDEQNPSFTYSNAGGFQLSAYLRFADKRITRSGLGNATSGTYTFTLTEAERTTLRNATPNSNTMKVILGVETNIGGTVDSYEVAREVQIINANPTEPTLTYADTNATTTAITGNNQRIIRNKSILTAQIGVSTAKKGATIKSYSTTINGVNKAGNGAVNFGTVNSSANVDLITTVTDSRGNTATVKKTVIIDDWSTPTASVDLYRINNYETESKIKVDATYSSLNGKNAITIQYRHKITTDSTYSAWGNLNNNALGTFQLNNNYDWNIQVQIRDHLSSWVTYSLILPKGKPILFIDTGKQSVGVGKFPVLENSLEVEGEGHFTGGIGTSGNITVLGDIFLRNTTVQGMASGTWTPTIGALNESDPTINYTERKGTYYIIGKLVFVSFFMRGTISSLNGANNYACIKGLPFTAKDYILGEQSFPIGIIYNLTTSENNLTLGINNQVIRIQAGNGSGATTLKVTSSGNFAVGASGWFEIA